MQLLQYAAIELLSAWQKSVSPGVDGCKNVFNVMDAVNVGDARLPSVPISSSDAAKLKSAVEEACKMPALSGVQAKICAKRGSEVKQ